MKKVIAVLGVAGLSLSAIFVRWSTAPAPVLALYRMGLAALLLLPLLAPDLLDDLPPPALDQILGLLAGMLGLPF